MDSIDKIIRQLTSKDLELRCCAALVLGRLRPVEDRVLGALRRALSRAEPATHSYFLDALAATRDPSVLEDVVPFLEATGSIVEQAVRVVRGFKARALAPIERAHAGHLGWINGAFVKAVAGIHHARSIRMLLDRLPHSDWQHARAISICLRENFDSYPEAAKTLLVERVIAGLEHGEPSTAVITHLKLAALAGDAVHPRLLMKFIGPDHAPAVRRHALLALESKPITAARVRRYRPEVMRCLEERGIEDMVKPALEVLASWSDVPMSLEELDHLSGFFFFPVAEFALRELARHYPAEAAARIVPHLDARSSDLRDTAIRILCNLPDGPQHLVDLMMSDASGGYRLHVAERLARSGAQIPDATLARLRRAFVARMLSEGYYDRPLLEFLGQHDRDRFNRAVRDRARKLRREGRLGDVITLLQPVVRWRQATEEVRFMLALANLEIAATLDEDDLSFKRCINLLSPLCRTWGFDVTGRFRRAKQFTASQRLAVAEHLRLRGAREGEVAREMTDHLKDAELTDPELERLTKLRAALPPSAPDRS